MKNPFIIRKVYAFVMLVLFTLSVTPKTYLHDCLADHGNSTKAYFDGNTIVTKTGFDCHCDELVVSAPFTETVSEFHLTSFFLYKALSSPPYQPIFYKVHSTKDSRGPPAVA